MARIKVESIGGPPNYEFQVLVAEGGTRTRHQVRLKKQDYDRYVAHRPDTFIAPEQVVETAFRFLLEREPQSAIMSKFDVRVISKYFPEFERVFPGML